MRGAPKKQHGFVTLVVSSLVLFLATFAVFFGSKSSLLELRSTNNAYRTQVAFENAEDGMRRVLADLTAAPEKAAADYATTPATVTTTTGRYVARYVFNGGSNAYIESTGWDQGDARRTITQRIVYVPGAPPVLGSRVTDAVTVLGDASLSGSTELASVRSGGSVNVSGAARVGEAHGNDSQFRVNMTDSTGAAIYDSSGRPLQRRMTSDEYFDYYLGSDLCPAAHAAARPANCKSEAKAVIAARPDGYICTSSCNNADLLAQYRVGKRLMWLEEGGMQINANVVLGSIADPVTVLVMNSGTIKINGTSRIYGVLFVDVPHTTVNGSCACTASKTVTSKSGNSGTWSGIQYALTPNVAQLDACSDSACAGAVNKCEPSSSFAGKKVDDKSSCNYTTDLLVGSESQPIQIEVLGTWNNTGGGNSLIEGAAITTGNFATTGNMQINYNGNVLNNLPKKPPSVVRQVTGWSDMN